MYARRWWPELKAGAFSLGALPMRVRKVCSCSKLEISGLVAALKLSRIFQICRFGFLLAQIRLSASSLWRPFPPASSARFANAFEPIQDGRIYIEKSNAPFLYELKGTPAEYKAGLLRAIANGWLELHESGTYVKLSVCGDVCVIWLAAAIDTSAFEGEAVSLFSI